MIKILKKLTKHIYYNQNMGSKYNRVNSFRHILSGILGIIDNLIIILSLGYISSSNKNGYIMSIKSNNIIKL